MPNVATRPELVADPKELISEELFTKLSARVLKDHPDLTQDQAERSVTEGLDFLQHAAQQFWTESDEKALRAPSPVADIGWHTFILHTLDYAEFCARVTGGYYIQHVPTGDSCVIDDSPVTHNVAKCTQCHAGCTDSPKKMRVIFE